MKPFQKSLFPLKRQKISEILHDELVRKSLSKSRHEIFSNSLESFFYAAKYKYATWVLSLALTMNFLINRKG